jgi:hypothetical protein
MELKFRTLKEDEIECRVNQINDKGLTLLLYKDARCDMNILDETVGAADWEREHKELKGNIYCGVSIYDKEKDDWVTKWDAGKESNTEAEKGEASDSFKRACVNWGIGRELYTSPLIWIPGQYVKISKNEKGKWCTYDKFKVERIKYNDKREIIGLSIKNQNGKRVFLMKPQEVANENNK